MTMSVRLAAAHAKAQAIDKKLKATQFKQTVTVQDVHGDFFYANKSALVKKLGAEFVAVFTEHDGFRVYVTEDVAVTIGRRL